MRGRDDGVPIAAPVTSSASEALGMAADLGERAVEVTNQDRHEWSDCNVQLNTRIPDMEPFEHPILERLTPGERVVFRFDRFERDAGTAIEQLPSDFDPFSGSQLILSCMTPIGPRVGIETWGNLVEEPPTGEGVVVGRPYPYDLYTHCGIRDARFDGRVWVADPPLGDVSPPEGWGDPSDRGTMTLVTETLAVFRSSGGDEARFRPRRATDPEIPPCA